ncbi:hypothetical protein J1N35_006612 [Gossypium stocksii]|uniref:Uncharacterized protein n=1 Tax=Gossypium stocksii TaxID=47602 RepID=A0A9D4AI85_9ROSI|nr:hypothetical protein J1N35_006612 [Gossypium stocksii]
MGDVKETIKVVKGHIDKLESMRKQLRNYVMETLNFNRDTMRETLNGAMNDQIEKLPKKNYALKKN